MALMRPHATSAHSVRRVRDIVPAWSGHSGPLMRMCRARSSSSSPLSAQRLGRRAAVVGAARTGRTAAERAIQGYLKLRVAMAFHRSLDQIPGWTRRGDTSGTGHLAGDRCRAPHPGALSGPFDFEDLQKLRTRYSASRPPPGRR